MKKNLRSKTLILLIIILCFLSFPLLAEEKVGEFNLYEPEEEFNIVQILENFSDQVIFQGERPNNSFISQFGDNNWATIEQNGFGNSANILQLGSHNEAYIKQDGCEFIANIEQYGNNHYASINQPYDDPVEHEIIQNGSNNLASSSILGINKSLKIEQSGNNLRLSIDILSE